MLAESFVELLKSWPHWGFELLSDALFTAVGALFVKPLVRRHDHKHHDRV